jgi:hypothetical protein
MTAALGTLPFLATLWLLVVLGAAALEESGAKIAAALKGHSRGLPSGHCPQPRIRTRAWLRQPAHPRPTWRAAA